MPDLAETYFLGIFKQFKKQNSGKCWFPNKQGLVFGLVLFFLKVITDDKVLSSARCRYC